MSEVKKQKTGDNSTNIQADSIAVKQTVNLTVGSVEGLSKELLSSVFGELPQSVKDKIAENQSSFLEALKDKLKSYMSDVEEVKSVINSPDFQYITKKATLAASRSDSVELHENLAILLGKRVSNDKEDIKRIVFNESIETADKLTKDHLNILAMVFICSCALNSPVNTITDFDNFLETMVAPFLGTSLTNSQFQYLEYTRCASSSALSRNLIQIFQKNYTLPFMRGLEKDKVDQSKLSNEAKALITTNEDDYLVIKAQNQKVLEDYLDKNNFSEEDKKELKDIYGKMIPSTAQVEEDLKDKTKSGNKIFDSFSKTLMNRLQLSAVGIAIAATYFEKVTDQKLNIDIWIN